MWSLIPTHPRISGQDYIQCSALQSRILAEIYCRFVEKKAPAPPQAEALAA
jgi:hypothetical protein